MNLKITCLARTAQRCRHYTYRVAQKFRPRHYTYRVAQKFRPGGVKAGFQKVGGEQNCLPLSLYIHLPKARGGGRTSPRGGGRTSPRGRGRTSPRGRGKDLT